MSEEFHLLFETEADALTAERQLGTLAIDGRPAMRVRRTGTDIMTGCGIFEKLEGDPVLAGEGCPDIRFLSSFYLAEGVKSGMHHPDGIFWVRRPDRRHQVFSERVPLLAVAPTLLALQGVTVPEWMRGPVLGEAIDAQGVLARA
jgi:hypothetical protein